MSLCTSMEIKLLEQYEHDFWCEYTHSSSLIMEPILLMAVLVVASVTIVLELPQSNQKKARMKKMLFFGKTNLQNKLDYEFRFHSAAHLKSLRKMQRSLN